MNFGSTRMSQHDNVKMSRVDVNLSLPIDCRTGKSNGADVRLRR